jgi:hypothetical protein
VSILAQPKSESIPPSVPLNKRPRKAGLFCFWREEVG